MIKIKRHADCRDVFRSYKIILDEKVIGKIKHGQEFEIEIPKGPHELYLKIDWCCSNSIYFELADDMVEFECGSNFSEKKLWKLPFYMLFSNVQYLLLKQSKNK